MTDPSPYITDEAVEALACALSPEAVQPILLRIEPAIRADERAKVQAEITRLGLWYEDGFTTGRRDAAEEAEEGQGPAAVAALKWAATGLPFKTTFTRAEVLAWLDQLAAHAEGP